MKKFFLLLFVLFILSSPYLFSQLTVGYTTDGNTLAVSTYPLKKVWGEFRVNTKSYSQAGWSYSDRGITQIYIMSVLFSSDKTSLYAGLGSGINAFTPDDSKWVSFNIPVGLRVNPIGTLPDFYIIGEYDPMIVVAEKTPVIHCISLGFRYILRKKS